MLVTMRGWQVLVDVGRARTLKVTTYRQVALVAFVHSLSLILDRVGWSRCTHQEFQYFAFVLFDRIPNATDLKNRLLRFCYHLTFQKSGKLWNALVAFAVAVE